MKVTSSIAAQKSAVAPVKSAIMPQQKTDHPKASPAYQVTLSNDTLQRNPARYIRHIEDTTTAVRHLDGIVPDGLDKVHQLMEKEVGKNEEQLRKTHPELFDETFRRLTDKDAPMVTFEDGLDFALISIQSERHRASYIGKMFHPLYESVQEHFDFYKDANKNLSHGTIEAFRAFNLKLAGIAKTGLDEYEHINSEYHIRMGDYTAEEVKNASSFSHVLQNASGVYVGLSFGGAACTSSVGIDFSYNGTLAKVGVSELDFMANHREAMDVWINAVQGRYQSGLEVKDALEKAGLDETANAYEKMRSKSPADIGYTYIHTPGKLWEIFAGYNKPLEQEETYYALQKRIRGEDTSSMIYNLDELNHAREEGYTEKRFLERVFSSRPPSVFTQDKNGEWHLVPPGQEKANKTEENEAADDETNNNPKHYADAAIKELKEKIAMIREQDLPIEQKQKLIADLKNKILSYQMMKLRDQKNRQEQSQAT